MTLRSALLPRVLLAASLLLTACGRDDAGSAKSGGSGGGVVGGGALTSVVKPDTAPWSDDPAGAAWEACAWVPLGEQAELWRFDWRTIQSEPTPWRSTSAWYDGVATRRTWVRTLGLPEDALGDVIAVDEPFRFQACLPRVPEAEIVSGLVKKGFVEAPLGEGGRGFRWPDGDSAFVAFVDGRLILGAPDEERLRQILAVRRGSAKSLQAAPGMRAACAAGSKGMPVDVEAGRTLKRRRPSDPPAPLAVVSVTTPGARLREDHALECSSAEARDAVQRMLEGMIALRPDVHPDDVFTLGHHGMSLRFSVVTEARRDTQKLRRAAADTLGVLTDALQSFQGRHGAFPTPAQGLGALKAEPESLDGLLGVIPLDPWGKPYLYEPGHVKRPDGFVLRSLGPDGEVDTEDDVLPEERER